MTYENFKTELASELSNVLEVRGHSVDVHEITAQKANRELEGLTVKLDGQSVAPTMYTQSAYEHFQDSELTIRETAEKMADAVEAAYESYRDIGFDQADFNKDYIMEHAELVVVNTEMNRAMLSKIPHEEVSGTDLSCYCKVRISDSASITISNDHCYQLGCTGSEILEVARQQTLEKEYTVRSMIDVLSQMIPPEMVADGIIPIPEQSHPEMLVISNRSGIDGAQAILSQETLDKACEMMGCDRAVILPSSRHELLAVSSDGVGAQIEDFKGIVEYVNETQVSLEDKLSDNIYRYNSLDHKLELCDERGMFPEHEVETGRSVGYQMAM